MSRFDTPSSFLCVEVGDEGAGLCSEMICSASHTGPFMYPFATGATGEYFPWLREFGGRADSRDVSPRQGKAKEIPGVSTGSLAKRPRKTYPPGLFSSTEAPLHQRVSRIGPAQLWRSTPLGPVWQFMFGGAVFGERCFFRSGRGQGRTLGLVLLDSPWSEQ